MTQVLFIQGAGEGAHRLDAELAQALREQLGPGFEIDCPEMPNESEPDFEAWRTVIARKVSGAPQGLVLVAHSAGGTILMSYLAEEGASENIISAFVIGAPFFGEGGWQVPGFTSPQAAGAAGNLPLYLYHGVQDETAPIAHLSLYATAFPNAVLRRLEGRNHQLNNDLTEVAADLRNLVTAARGS